MTVFSIRNTISTILISGCALFFSSPASGYDAGPIKLHGFLSQGYILTDGNNVHAKYTRDDGSFAFNEIGLNASYQLKDSIVFNGQLISRDLGDEGNNNIYIDYLQADIQFTDWFGTRLGRFKVPLGFYNQTRDIDLARPTVFLPQTIYIEAYRPFVASATGGLIYGNIHHDTFGDLDYELFYGIPGEDNDSCLVQSLEDMLQGTNMDMNADDAYGISLQYTPSLNGLRLGATVISGNADFNYTDLKTGYASTTSGYLNPLTVFSIEYAIEDFTFVSEYMYCRQYTSWNIGPISLMEDKLSEPEGFYIGGSYRVTDQFEAALYWENYYGDKNNKHGSTQQARGQDKYQAWHKAWKLALRYDITDWWLIKAEGQIINGTALTSPHYNDPGTQKQYWNSLSLKTTFYF